MSNSKHETGMTKLETIKEEHKMIIDSWFNNGFNGSKAVMEIRPEVTYNTARVMANAILKEANNQEYIQEKRQELRAKANIETEQLTTELINWIYSDPTDYIGLSVNDLKSLPNEIKRCLTGVKHRIKEYKTLKGQDVREEVIEVKIADKTKAIDILNKMLGNYSLNNKQKATTINIQQILMGMNDDEQKQTLRVLAKILPK